MSKRALIILAEGAEEMEAVITIDTLRRGGIDVTVAGLAGKDTVKCSRMVSIVPDTSLEEAHATSPYDAVILPGGLKGSELLSEAPLVGQILKQHENGGKIVAAICAAPIAFKSHSIALGKQITSYPSMKERLVDNYKYVDDERVVIDGNVTTSQGPGTAFEFALSLVEQLAGKEAADPLVNQMLLKL
ncbi:protein dj-1beta-like [Daphnia carinata]|uniref:protein dj-1beta-like n=1 Tax=Daphnia carinata TaxID=120202 RepID=UPI002579A694|nr:protein dj-1beta-like [Daphnia carinata]